MKIIPWVALAVLVLVVGFFAFNSYIYNEKQEDTTTATAEVVASQEANTNVQTPALKSKNLYTNDVYDFSVELPATWKVARTDLPYPGALVSFGPASRNYGANQEGSVFISVYKSSETSVDTLTKGMGKQFGDRQEKRERLTINGEVATRITVTTPSLPNWYLEQIFLQKGENIFVIGNGGNKEEALSDIYMSFKLK